MKEIKVLVLCSSRFAGTTMHQLLQAGLLKAVAVPAKNDEAAEFAEAVLRGSNIPVIRVTAEGYASELKNIITDHGINLCLTLTFSYRIPADVLDLPALGFYNFHPGPLPLYRGPDPIFQQIKRREEYAGIVLHRMDEHFDTGPVIMQEKIKILPADTYGTISSKLGFTAAKMTGVLLKMLMMDLQPPAKIQDESAATYYKRQSAAEVIIQWDTMTADEIIALIRACNPWNKGAVTEINRMVMRLPAGEKSGTASPAGLLPGTIISISENELVIAAINEEAVSVPFVQLDEGFFKAGDIKVFGFAAGMRCTTIK